MASKLKVEYPGALYHVRNRGDRCEPISRDNLNRQRFVQTRAMVCAEPGRVDDDLKTPMKAETIRRFSADMGSRELLLCGLNEVPDHSGYTRAASRARLKSINY